MLGCPTAAPNVDLGASDKQASEKKDTRKEVPQKFKSLHIEGNLDSHGANKPGAEAASSSSKFLRIGTHAIQMKEFAATDYGLYIWPCSIILGCYLHQHRQELCKGLLLYLERLKSFPEFYCQNSVCCVCIDNAYHWPSIYRSSRVGAGLWDCSRWRACSKVYGNCIFCSLNS